MNNKEVWLYGIIGFLLGIVITVLVAGSTVNNQYGGMMSMMGIRSNWDGDARESGRSKNMMGNMDRHFIEQMIPHHEDAITMADIALRKAGRQEIKSLASDINRTQSAEIAQMEQWYQEWFKTDVPENTTVMGMHGMGTGINRGGMHMGMMGDETDIQALENASDFDRAFITEMIPHHQMAVMMANMLLVTTDRPEMKKLAEDIVSAQTKEINDMRAWAKQWGY